LRRVHHESSSRLFFVQGINWVIARFVDTSVESVSVEEFALVLSRI